MFDIKRLLHTSIPLLFLAFIIWLALPPSNSGVNKSPSPELEDRKNDAQANLPTTSKPPRANTPRRLKQSEQPSDIRSFIAKFQTADTASRKNLISQGLLIAKQRKMEMKRLMKESPEQAMKQALRLDEWLALPEEVRTNVETPFSNIAEFNLYPHCCDSHDAPHQHNDDTPAYTRTYHGMNAFTFGARNALTSKTITSTYGIQIDGEVLLDESPVKILDVREIEAARQLFPESPRTSKVDPITGNPASEEIVALIGGKLHGFENLTTLQQTVESLAKAESSLAPHSMIYAMDALNGADLYAPETIANAATVEASTWTETPKKVLFIRVHFTDKTTTPFTQAELLTMLNNSSNLINEMSYGKTELISPEVTTNSLALSRSSSQYLATSSPSPQIIADAKTLAAEAGYTLSNYDIIGVSFPYVSGLGYSGRASIGGSSHWLNGSISTGTMIHEFGHNYGLRHSSFWDTSDGSVMGAGSHIEYGDIFDMMGYSGSYPDGHFSAYGKSRLNWIPDSKIISTTATTGTYRIYRADHTNSYSNSALALKLQKGDSEELWISYRKNFTANSYLSNGLYIQWNHNDSSNPFEARLLDMTPGTSTKNDSALSLNTTFSDSSGNLYITPVAQGGTAPNEWIDIFIGIAGNNAPEVSFTLPSITARTEFSVSGNFTDSDEDPMTYLWDFGDGSPSVTAASPSHTYHVGGSYTVTASALDGRGGVGQHSIVANVSDPLASWTDLSTGNTESYGAVAYGNGLTVVGGRGIYTSVNLAEWWSTSFSNNYVTDIEFLDGRFYSCGFHYLSNGWYGVVRSSLDGRNWNEESTGTHGKLHGITHTDSITIAVGASGLIKRKSNGAWSTITPPNTSTTLYDVIANGQTVVAVGSSGTIFTSTDQGLTWQDNSPSSALNNFHAVHYAKGKFLAQSFGKIFSSPDGITWTDHASTTSFVQGITDGAGLIVSVGEEHITTSGEDIIFVSSDGNNYHKINLTATDNLRDITFGNGRFTTVGDNGSVRQSGLFTSGNTAPTITVSGPSSAQTHTNVTFTALATDTDGDPLQIIWDLDQSEPIPNGSSATYRFPSGGTHSVTAYAVDGNGGVASHTMSITINNPLANWNAVTTGATQTLYAIDSVNNQTILAGGYNSCFVSTDGGNNWSSSTLPPNSYIYGFYQDGANSYAAGSHYNEGWEGALFYSSDNLTWSLLTTPSGLPDLKAITKSANGKLVAVGLSGTILYSTNGTTWTAQTSGTSEDLNGVAVTTDNIFVAAGDAQTVLRSTDGTNWAPPSSSPAAYNSYESAFAFNNEIIIGGAYSGFRRADSNADIWTSSSPSYISANLKDIAYGSGIFLSVGYNNNGSGNYDAYWTSTDGTNWSEVSVGSGYHSWKASTYCNGRFYAAGNNGAIYRSDPLAPVGYDAWQAAYIPSGGTPALPLSDYDQDQMSNLLEYALGSDPANGTSSSNPVVTTTDGVITFKIIKPAAATDVTYSIEHSSDLTGDSWSSSEIVVDYDTSVLYQAHILAPENSDKLFYRVRVSRP